MHCSHCGKYLPAESRFCNFCGTNLIVLQEKTREPFQIPISKAHNIEQEENKSANQDSFYDDVIFSVHPSFFSTGISYLIAAIFSLIASLGIGYFGLPISALVILVLLLFLVPAYRHLKRNQTTYTLTTSKVEINAGLLSKTTRHIPLRNIQDVLISVTLTERLLGIGSVLIDSASEAGKIQMQQIRNPRKHADLILQQLHRWQSTFQASRQA